MSTAQSRALVDGFAWYRRGRRQPHVPTALPVALPHRTFGRPAMTLTLMSDIIALTLEPDFSARVTALTDRRSGRQWLVAGGCVAASGDRPAYSAAQACGWHECFPNIAVGDDPVWGDLRDHGVVWGRPWQVTQHLDRQHCPTTHRSPLFEFERCLGLDGTMLTAAYSVANRAASRLRYL